MRHLFASPMSAARAAGHTLAFGRVSALMMSTMLALPSLGCAVGGTDLQPVSNDVVGQQPVDMGNTMQDMGALPDMGETPDTGMAMDLGATDMGASDMGSADMSAPDNGQPCGGASPCCGDGVVESPETCDPAAPIGAGRCPVNGTACATANPATPCVTGNPTTCSAMCVPNNCLMHPTSSCC